MVHRTSLIVVSFVLLLIPKSYSSESNVKQSSSPKSDDDLVAFTQNLAYLGADFFLFGSMGHGLDYYAPELVQGGPSPIGGRRANLDPLTRNVTYQFGLVAAGHLRAIKREVKGFPRPLLDISQEIFAKVVDSAFGRPLRPPFDPYANTLNYRLATFLVSLIAPTQYAGFIPNLQKPDYKEVMLVAGLLGATSGIHSTNRAALYEEANLVVPPYNFRVSEFTDRIAAQANRLGKEGTKSEGILVPPSEGAEGKVSGNVIEGDKYSLTYRRMTPEGVLRIIYGSGDERVPGGFFPKGANGRIAEYYLKE